MYSFYTWVLSKKTSDFLAAYDIRIFLTIFVHLYEDEWFRSLYKNKMNERYHDYLVVNKIRLSKLRWAGHLIRMDKKGRARKW